MHFEAPNLCFKVAVKGVLEVVRVRQLSGARWPVRDCCRRRLRVVRHAKRPQEAIGASVGDINRMSVKIRVSEPQWLAVEVTLPILSVNGGFCQ